MSPFFANEEENRLRLLLEERARIDAQIASLKPTNTPQTPFPQHGRPQVPSTSVPRSHSFAGQSMSRTVSSGRSRHEATLMSTSVSQRSAPTLQNGPSPAHAFPFTKSGRLPPSIQTFDGRRENVSLDSWTTSPDDLRSAYTFQPRQPTRSLSQRKSDLEQVDEIDSGEHPAEYFARMPTFSVTPSPIDIPTGGLWRNSTHRNSTSSRRRPSIGITSPSTPNSTTLTTATTCASDMSRQSSFCNDAILGPFEMMNVHSNTSIFTDSNSTDERSYPSSISFPTYPKLPSSEEQSQLLAGIGRLGEESQFLHSFHDFETSTTQFPPVSPSLEGMKRSPSNESDSSSISATSRATTQLKRQIQQACSRPIAPAPKSGGGDDVAMSREGSSAMISVKSNDGSGYRAVAALTKQPYQRPKHARVYCDRCNECSDGFRGQHELGRHYDRQHKMEVKKWVCAEPSDGVYNTGYRPVNSLANCKACSQQRKYGAYYNAAAHLRRAHFKPKQRGRGKSSKAEDKSEKRGGKGGGDWPPMPELKRWMKVVFESANERQQEDDDEIEEDEEVNDDDDGSGTYEVDEYAKMQDVSNIPSINSDFDNQYVYNDAAQLEIYQSQPSNFDLQSMQCMPYDNFAITQSIDNSMHIDSSQSSFAESQFASMNGQMPFIDNFPQPFQEFFS